MRRDLRRTAGGVALILALVVAWLPLLPPHALAGASALSDWARAEAVHAAVMGGDLLPAWLPDLYDRLGTPLPSFYAPLSYFATEAMRLATGDPAAAQKLAYLFFWIVGAAGAAFAGRALFGIEAGAATAAAFALSPYLLADVYVRTGIAELAALAIAPWALAALAQPGKAAAAGGVAAVAALVLTHNLTALLVVPALGLVAAFSPRPRRGLAIVGAGLALSLFFWLPALAEKRFLWADESLTGGFFDYTRHFVTPRNLLPFRTSVEFTVGPRESASFRWGEILWLGLVAAPFAARGLESEKRRRTLALAALALVALVMTTPLAAPLWRAIPLVRFVQFPFRFFLLATLCAAPLVGLAVSRFPERWRAVAAAATAALALLLALPLLAARYLLVDRASGEPRPVAARDLDAAAADPALVEPGAFLTIDFLRRAQASGAAGHEYLPRTVTVLADAASGPEAAALASGPGIVVESAEWGYPEVRARVRVAEAGDLVLQQFWFPGWRVEVDGAERVAHAEPGRGRIVVALAPGDREIVARFGPTALRRTARAASLLAALGIALWLLRRAPA